MEIVNRNIKAGNTSCYIFEVGNVFLKNNDPIQKEILNGAIFGNSWGLEIPLMFGPANFKEPQA